MPYTDPVPVMIASDRARHYVHLAFWLALLAGAAGFGLTTILRVLL